MRDLMLGPRRFTDLGRSLGGITPTRLTERLRSLEAMGIIAREPQSTGREVWYRLTPAGEDLRPVIEGLVLWGMEHAFEPPRPGEPIHPDHVMLATRMWLDRHRVRPRNPVVWASQFRNGYEYTLRFADEVWTLTRGADDAARVKVVAPAEAWVRFITDRSSDRALSSEDIELVGTGAATKAFARAFNGWLEGAGSAHFGVPRQRAGGDGRADAPRGAELGCSYGRGVEPDPIGVAAR